MKIKLNKFTVLLNTYTGKSLYVKCQKVVEVQ